MAYLGISLEEVFKATEIKCGYRNCPNSIIMKDNLQKYCCSSCRSSERVYVLRDRKGRGKKGRPKGYRSVSPQRKLKQEILSRKIKTDENGIEL
jgi:hypothetical protein